MAGIKSLHQKKTVTGAATQIETHHWHETPSLSDEDFGGTRRSLRKMKAGPVSLEIISDNLNVASTPNMKRNHVMEIALEIRLGDSAPITICGQGTVRCLSL